MENIKILDKKMLNTRIQLFSKRIKNLLEDSELVYYIESKSLIDEQILKLSFLLKESIDELKTRMENENEN